VIRKPWSGHIAEPDPERRRPRAVARALSIAATTIGLAVVALAWSYPAIGAAACARCYGMEWLEGGIVVDAAMPQPLRSALLQGAAQAQITVGTFFDGFDRVPIVVACSTDTCDRRLGGRGARATTMSTPAFTVVRVSPRGIDPTILVHEYAHVELHRRIGVLNLLRGAIPAWFDEGVAVIVSEDARYLKPGLTAAQRCMAEPRSELPASPWEWGPLAGRDHSLYADAACRVLRWMETNGGRAGLLVALDAAGRGEPLRP
jgi:hypothetical protein